MFIPGVLAVWFAWQALDLVLEGRKVYWYLIVAALSVGWWALFDWTECWKGLGIAGAVLILAAVMDLLLVATDAVKVSVLRKSR